MSYTDAAKEISAAIKERAADPLLRTYFISWLLYHWKGLFILFVSNKNAEERMIDFTQRYEHFTLPLVGWTFQKLGLLFSFGVPLVMAWLFLWSSPKLYALVFKIRDKQLNANEAAKSQSNAERLRASTDERKATVELEAIQIEADIINKQRRAESQLERLDEREKTQQEKQLQLDERERQIEERQKQLTEQNDSLNSQQADITQSLEALGEQEKALIEKEKQLNQRNGKLTDRERKVSEQERQLEEHERKITELEQLPNMPSRSNFDYPIPNLGDWKKADAPKKTDRPDFDTLYRNARDNSLSNELRKNAIELFARHYSERDEVYELLTQLAENNTTPEWPRVQAIESLAKYYLQRDEVFELFMKIAASNDAGEWPRQQAIWVLVNYYAERKEVFEFVTGLLSEGTLPQKLRTDTLQYYIGRLPEDNRVRQWCEKQGFFKGLLV